VDATKGKDKLVARVTSGLRDLLVLKSTGSAFENFVRDEYTTLAEVNDRIFSTAIDLSYTFGEVAVPGPTVSVSGVSGTLFRRLHVLMGVLCVFCRTRRNSSGRCRVLVLATSGKVSFFLSSSLGVMFSFEYIILTLFPIVGIAASDLARTITLDVFATDESASVQATLYKMAQRLLVENKFIQSVTYTLPNKHYIPVDMKWAGVDNLNPYVFYCSTSQVHILDLSGYYSSHAPTSFDRYVFIVGFIVTSIIAVLHHDCCIRTLIAAIFSCPSHIVAHHALKSQCRVTSHSLRDGMRREASITSWVCCIPDPPGPDSAAFRLRVHPRNPPLRSFFVHLTLLLNRMQHGLQLTMLHHRSLAEVFTPIAAPRYVRYTSCGGPTTEFTDVTMQWADLRHRLTKLSCALMESAKASGKLARSSGRV
jgi:hypothetical protein